ncbi:phage minor capsid protein [Pseudomonas sp.]|uniref:phage minor capsid protein n=1 Tax=Pseudomonas sp. TaxID=306 RepID=UPI00262EED81|nr:phage minor capsid protein [Pseudomonas sp.]
MADRWGGATPAALLDDLGHAIAERYRRVELVLERKLRDLLERSITAPPDLSARLRAIRELRAMSARLVADLSPDDMAAAVAAIAGGASSAEISRLLLDMPGLGASTVTAGGLYGVAAAEVDLRDGLRALNERILRAPADAYRAMTASTLADMLAGQATWEQTQRRQVDRYLADGITGFIDSGGRRWRIGSYAEMATRTAAARAWRDQSVASMRSHGIDTYQIVIGASACAECAAWAGKTLTDGGPVGPTVAPHAITGELVGITIDGTLADARRNGWAHPNCRCVLIPALPGYSAGSATTHDPAAELARDQMRALERGVRDARRTGGDVKAASAALTDHTRKHGLARRSWRTMLEFAGA